MLKRKLVLPREDKDGNHYISYSQLNTWKRSKREYIRQYFWGEGFEGNAYTDFGTKVGEALENGDYSEFTDDEQEFLKTVPRYGEYEREIRLEMDGFYVKGFIDTSSPEEIGNSEGEKPTMCVRRMADYKTGDIEKKRAEYESDDYIQVDIYAGAMKQVYGVLPEEVSVYLIHRTGNAFQNEELKLGNRYLKITKDVTDEGVKKVLEEVQLIAEEISAHYVIFKKLLGNE